MLSVTNSVVSWNMPSKHWSHSNALVNILMVDLTHVHYSFVTQPTFSWFLCRSGLLSGQNGSAGVGNRGARVTQLVAAVVWADETAAVQTELTAQVTAAVHTGLIPVTVVPTAFPALRTRARHSTAALSHVFSS